MGSIEGDGNVFLGANNLNRRQQQLKHHLFRRDSGRGGGRRVVDQDWYGNAHPLRRQHLHRRHQCQEWRAAGGWLDYEQHVRQSGGTLAGTGTVSGNVTNNGRVSPGALEAPGVLTVVHNYTQAQFATLMIQIAGVSPDQFSVLNVLGTANLNGFLDPVLLNGFVPTIGQSFTFLNYASFTGEFSHIKNQVFDHGMEQWSVIYQNNNAILTVEPHTRVPDQGSTFLLLTLGLLGLVTFRRQLLRGQP